MCLKTFLLISVGVFTVTSCPGGVTNPTILPASTTTSLSSSGEQRLIKTSEDEPAQWLDSEQIESLINIHANFVDITNHTQIPTRSSINTEGIPNSISLQATVRPMLEKLSVPRMQQFVKDFSSFHNRFFKTKSGLESQKWLLKQVEEALEGYSGQASVEEYSHFWPQSSVIATIAGSDPNTTNQVVIVGAHQDSINRGGSTKSAPGADDNATGSAILLEIIRVIVETKFIPRKTLEFQWYAAEEVGLRGSGDIAKDYSNSGANVISMLNYDVAGYQTNAINDIGIYTDHTNPQLNEFLRILVDSYCEWGWRNTTCGYGCSDHASWTSYNFPASMASEVVPNPHMHTVKDHYDAVEFPQVLEFSKLGLGYVVEMSG